MRAPQLVAIDELAERLWGSRPPVHPKAAIHTLVTRLRQRLGEGGLIHTEHGGYSMTPEHLDLERFRAHLLAADRAGLAGDAAAEAGELRAGLALWRGPVLVDAPSDSLQRAVVPMLVEERLAALQRRIALDFSLGRAGALIAELRGLTEEYPLREWFWARLMLALHRCDRQAEALATYETVRRRLVEELGIEPGRELRRAHAQVLAGEPPEPAARGRGQLRRAGGDRRRCDVAALRAPRDRRGLPVPRGRRSRAVGAQVAASGSGGWQPPRRGP